MFSMLFSNIYVGLVVIAFFGITIFIHELGHYLVARGCGLKVKVFAIGFGPALWKKEINGVLYKIGCIPFGGYVSLPQLDPTAMQSVQGKTGNTPSRASDEDLQPVAAWKKIMVSLAGAAGNVILAVVIAWMVFWIGMPATTASQDTILGYVHSQSALYQHGVRIGDRILHVNGTPVSTWSQFIQEAAMYDEVILDVETSGGELIRATVPTSPWQYGIRMVDGIDVRTTVTVGLAEPGMSAAEAGVKAGDIIVAFAGHEILSSAHLIEQVGANRGETVDMTVQRRTRDGMSVDVTVRVTPVYDPKHEMTRIGIHFQRPEQQLDTAAKVHPLPMMQIRHHASAIGRFLRDLATPKKSARAANMVGGPVAIITYYVGMVQASLMLAVWFTGFLNINLAIINLLPIPILDGGHIVFSLWEMIFKRPIKAKIINLLVNIFAVLLIGVFLLLSFRDVDRHTPAGRIVRHFLDRGSAAEPEDGTEAAEMNSEAEGASDRMEE